MEVMFIVSLWSVTQISSLCKTFQLHSVYFTVCTLHLSKNRADDNSRVRVLIFYPEGPNPKGP